MEIVRARALEAKDYNGKSDPFVVVELGNSRLRTKTIQGDLNPVWNETMSL